MAAPGVQVERVDLVRPRLDRLRTDIAGFLGYAERGPLFQPVRLTSWRQFVDAFGPPLSPGHTGEAVRLFFENGGEICYMQRLADLDPERGAATAGLDLPLGGPGTGYRLMAGFASIGRPRADGAGPVALPDGAGAGGGGLESPGQWGNRLSVVIRSDVPAVTETLGSQPADGLSFRVTRLAGLQPGDWLRVVQGGHVSPRLVRIHSIDRGLRELRFTSPVVDAGLSFAQTMVLEAVALSIELRLDGQTVERHDALLPDPDIRPDAPFADHPRRLDRVLRDESRLLVCQILSGLPDMADSKNWPVPGPAQSFLGGRDGLAGVDRNDFLFGLKGFEAVDEIAVLAAPDLVLVAEAPAAPSGLILIDQPCLRLEAPPTGQLKGQVLDAATGLGLGFVRIEATGQATGGRAPAVLTAADGSFEILGLEPGQANLRLLKAGYAVLEGSAQVFATLNNQSALFSLAPLTLPPAFGADDIFMVQEAMAAQGEQGLYRVALLDPPADAATKLEAITDWRQRFDTSHAALYWPWVNATRADGSVAAMPPSGAVAGLIARMDLAEGPQRAPANRPLKSLTSLATQVSSAAHEMLNDLGINVLRADPGRGIAPQGARTMSSDPELRFLNVRRLLLMIAEAIEDGHQWAVFEPNAQPLRDAITHSLTTFLAALWRQGAFAGITPEAAFAVKCDAENNPPSAVDAGQLIAQIAVAPVRPYEFIRLRLGRAERLTVQVETR